MEKWEELHAIGYAHQLQGEWDRALHCYEQALARKPDYALAQVALGQIRMMQSCFHEGRELFEARFTAREGDQGFDWRQLPTPRWQGQLLKGKHLYLWAEQGFGDVVMYAAFLPRLLAQEPACITLGMFPKMMNLFSRSFPDVVVESLEDTINYALSSHLLDIFPQMQAFAQKAGLQIDMEPMRKNYERTHKRGAYDYAAPMGDMLVYCMPAFVPAMHQGDYLVAGPERALEMRKKLKALGAGRRIGISWLTTNSQSGYARNIPLEQWAPILSSPDCHFIALQHHVSPPEIERFNAENGFHIVNPGFDPVWDIEGLAALTSCLDEVITIDNSTAHLAGALGVPTTVLLPKGCDFRWPMLPNKSDTLWYRSVKLERQTHAMDWQPVIETVAQRLYSLISA